MSANSDVSIIKQWLGSGSVNIFGRPHAGKDTQGKRLAELLDGVLLGGGDILRGSEIPEHVKQHMHAGKLIPTDEYLKIVLPYLKREELRDRILILSSVGRWHGEEAGFLEAMAASNHPLKAVVYLKMEESEVWRRWQEAAKLMDRGERYDDSKDALAVRLEEFNQKTLPVIEFYRDQNLLIEVDANQTHQKVTEDILQKLSLLAG